MKDKTYDLTRIALSPKPKHNLGEHKCLNEGALHRILYREEARHLEEVVWCVDDL